MVHPPYTSIYYYFFFLLLLFFCRQTSKLLLSANGPFLKGYFSRIKSITCTWYHHPHVHGDMAMC